MLSCTEIFHEADIEVTVNNTIINFEYFFLLYIFYYYSLYAYYFHLFAISESAVNAKSKAPCFFLFFYFFVKYHMLCNCLKQNRLLCTSVSSIQTSNVIIHGQEATFFYR